MRYFLPLVALAVILPLTNTANGALVGNLALNPSRTGSPNPLESDRGWGGGTDVWDLVDGVTQYSSWAEGLAFTGGDHNWAGEVAGLRQTTIDFGELLAFNTAVLWHHGDHDVPGAAFLDFWDGSKWNDIQFSRDFAEDYPVTASGWSRPDSYSFDPVVGSKLRYSFDNSQASIVGEPMRHGWIYEVEVFNNAPQSSGPRTIFLPDFWQSRGFGGGEPMPASSQAVRACRSGLVAITGV